MKTKQVIVMRAKYPDGQGGTRTLRKGKLVAQGSHASMAFLSKRVREAFGTGQLPKFSEEELAWLEGSFAKVCLYVDTEEQLLQIFHKAREQGLTAELITDSGLTEFHGVPTNTCIAIGPHEASKIDPITGDLKLL